MVEGRLTFNWDPAPQIPVAPQRPVAATSGTGTSLRQRRVPRRPRDPGLPGQRPLSGCQRPHLRNAAVAAGIDTVLTDETRFVDVHDQGRCPTRSVWPTAPSCWSSRSAGRAPTARGSLPFPKQPDCGRASLFRVCSPARDRRHRLLRPLPEPVCTCIGRLLEIATGSREEVSERAPGSTTARALSTEPRRLIPNSASRESVVSPWSRTSPLMTTGYGTGGPTVRKLCGNWQIGRLAAGQRHERPGL